MSDAMYSSISWCLGYVSGCWDKIPDNHKLDSFGKAWSSMTTCSFGWHPDTHHNIQQGKGFN